MLLHKKHIRLFAATLIFPAMLCGCIEDNTPEEMQASVTSPVDKELQEGNYVMAIDLKVTGIDDTVGEGGFTDGDHFEHEVKERGVFALFFDVDNVLQNMVDMRTYHFEEDGSEYNKNGVEGRYYATYKVRRGKIKPASCLVVVNASDEINEELYELSQKHGSLDEVLGIIWEEALDARNLGLSYYNNSPHYTMTNTVYVDKDGNLACAVPVDVDKNFVTEEELVAAGKDPYEPWDGTDFEDRVLVVPVERMMARFSFRIESDPDSNFDAQNNVFTPSSNTMVVYTGLDTNGNHKYDSQSYKYAVKVVGWGINALETKNYLFKNVKANGSYFSGWNDAANIRSYWSEDPHYLASDQYPSQYRNSINNTKLVTYEKLGEANMLMNYSYNNLNNGFNAVLYTPENTYDNTSNYSSWLTHYDSSRLHNLVGSHFILCTELQTNLLDDEGKPAKDIYRDREGVFYKSEVDYIKSTLQALTNYLSSQEDLEFTYYTWNGTPSEYTQDGKTIKKGVVKEGSRVTANTKGKWYVYKGSTRITPTNIDNLIKNGTIKKNSDGYYFTTESHTTYGDGKRLLWDNDFYIGDENGNRMQMCEIDPQADSKGQKIKYNLGPLDENLRKSLIFEWLGDVEHFNNGAMYYAAPIENVKVSGSTKNYGVVRNTWYKFILGNVNSLGTSVDNVDEPIVPGNVNHNDRLNFNIEILGWHSMDTDLFW